MNTPVVNSIEELIAVTLELGALEYAEISRNERTLAKRAVRVPKTQVQAFHSAIEHGEDPLGQTFSELKTPLERRSLGATYTPSAIVSTMTQWVAKQKPDRVVDPGAGSGRFIVAAGRALPKARLVAAELDPMAALMLRAHLQVTGLAARSTLFIGDYRELQLPPIAGRTAFLGNPPYVRHHLISAENKDCFAQSAASLGFAASRLAGLHVHFFVATAQKSQVGDIGAFITAAEWLDVNYGELPRKLLLERLGLTRLHVIEPTAKPFADADTTAVVVCFEVGQRPACVRIRRVHTIDQLGILDQGNDTTRKRFEQSRRWSTLTRPSRGKPRGYVELGELCQVHRGQVTGANQVWIAGTHSSGLPLPLLFPAITRARELFAAGHSIDCDNGLRSVIDLPPDLDQVPRRWRASVERFLKQARVMGADQGYIATHRRAWWSVGLRDPAPILASYMARRAPAFVRNSAGVRHINIAHGIYPREPMQQKTLNALVHYLRTSVSVNDGRVYAGGLTKFEPKEMERLLVPEPNAP